MSQKPAPQPHRDDGNLAADSLAAPSRTITRQPRELDLQTITEGAREVVILHNGDRYRLRVTANDKLILTK